jgi:flagellar biosynthetic protein FliQ
MSEAIFFDVLRQGLWAAVLVSAPLLAVALIVGLIIGLLQALTSIQETTLTFVPKIGAMMAVYWVSMSFMSGVLVTFFTDTIVPLISGI